MVSRFTIDEIRSRTYKSRDAWWTVLLVDPLASRLVQVAARYRWVTPNRLTVAAFGFGVLAAAAFAVGSYPFLLVGALLFHLSFVIDCMDGKIARLTGTGSVFGAWLDYVFDRLRVLVCAVALFGGQYARTDDLWFLAAAGVVIFLDMFRYLNALQMGKVRNDMRTKLAEVDGHGGSRAVFVEELVEQHPVGAAAIGEIEVDPDLDRPVVDVYGDFRARFKGFVRMRNYLVRKRIRAHLVSGIEFQMAVFIVGPVTTLIVPVTFVAGALLMLFEVALIYKLYSATKSFSARVAAAEETVPDTTVALA